MLAGVAAATMLVAVAPRVAQRIYPQTIYRTLAQLTQHGLVHRIASTNAYRACSRPGPAHDGIHFLFVQSMDHQHLRRPRDGRTTQSYNVVGFGILMTQLAMRIALLSS